MGMRRLSAAARVPARLRGRAGQQVAQGPHDFPGSGGECQGLGGASLASRLEAAARTGPGDSIAGDVLLATAVAVIQSPGAWSAREWAPPLAGAA